MDAKHVDSSQPNLLGAIASYTCGATNLLFLVHSPGHNLGPWCTKVRERKLVFLDDIWGSSRCLVSCACTFVFVMNRSDNDLGRISLVKLYICLHICILCKSFNLGTPNFLNKDELCSL